MMSEKTEDDGKRELESPLELSPSLTQGETSEEVGSEQDEAATVESAGFSDPMGRKESTDSLVALKSEEMTAGDHAQIADSEPETPFSNDNGKRTDHIAEEETNSRSPIIDDEKQSSDLPRGDTAVDFGINSIETSSQKFAATDTTTTYSSSTSCGSGSSSSSKSEGRFVTKTVITTSPPQQTSTSAPKKNSLADPVLQVPTMGAGVETQSDQQPTEETNGSRTESGVLPTLVVNGNKRSSEDSASTPIEQRDKEESQSAQVDPPADPPVRSTIDDPPVRNGDQRLGGAADEEPLATDLEDNDAVDEPGRSQIVDAPANGLVKPATIQVPKEGEAVPESFSFPQLPPQLAPVDDLSVYGSLHGNVHPNLQTNYLDGFNAVADDNSLVEMREQYHINPSQRLPPRQPVQMNGHLNFLAMQQHAQQQQQQFLQQALQQASFASYGAMAPMPAQPQNAPPSQAVQGGKRTIKLRLHQDTVPTSVKGNRRKSSSFLKRSTRTLFGSDTIMETEEDGDMAATYRGSIWVSWYEGTTSEELQQHVKRSVARKLQLQEDMELDDIRMLDTTVEPPEEIVLCPYIPTQSEFLLHFKTRPRNGYMTPTRSFGPPDSPSAAPSPLPTSGNLGTLNPAQLALLRKKLDMAQGAERNTKVLDITPRAEKDLTPEAQGETKSEKEAEEDHSDTNTLQPEDPIEAKLRQITELMLDQQARRHPAPAPKHEVVFFFTNYLTLFILMITIFAEIQTRAPEWLSWIETQLENVQNCSSDQDALFECVSKGEFAGLFASVILWLSRSAMTKRIFLFGFDTPKRLWTVVYESGVSSVCWGMSYIFIRRGLNADTRPNFLQKYWKDAMYGSLAGFNAAFMKAVLKNLIPQEAVEQALNDRQLKILSWLPSFA